MVTCPDATMQERENATMSSCAVCLPWHFVFVLDAHHCPSRYHFPLCTKYTAVHHHIGLARSKHATWAGTCWPRLRKKASRLLSKETARDRQRQKQRTPNSSRNIQPCGPILDPLQRSPAPEDAQLDHCRWDYPPVAQPTEVDAAARSCQK